MARAGSGTRITGWAGAAALLAAAPLMAACSSGDSHSSSAPARDGGGSRSAAPSPAPSNGAPDGPDGPDGSSKSPGGPSGTRAGDQATVSSAVSAWVGAVIEKDAKRTCLLSTVPGSDASPKAATPQTCDASTTRKMAPGLESMSKAFTPQHGPGQAPSRKPVVRTRAPTPAGDRAVVPTAHVTVDGKPLRAIILAGSRGVNPKTFSAKLKTVRIDGKWYVADFDLKSGD